MNLQNLEDLQILLHIIEFCLFLFTLFWIKMEGSKIIQLLPFKIMALLTIFITIVGGLALFIFDIVLLFKEL